MDIDSTKLTVFFEAPFWVGVFECIRKESSRCVKSRLVQNQRLRSLGVST